MMNQKLKTGLMEPHGQARGPPKPYPPTPRLRWVISWWAKSAGAWQIDCWNVISRINAFLHGQGRGLLRRRM